MEQKLSREELAYGNFSECSNKTAGRFQKRI